MKFFALSRKMYREGGPALSSVAVKIIFAKGMGRLSWNAGDAVNIVLYSINFIEKDRVFARIIFVLPTPR